MRSKPASLTSLIIADRRTQDLRRALRERRERKVVNGKGNLSEERRQEEGWDEKREMDLSRRGRHASAELAIAPSISNSISANASSVLTASGAPPELHSHLLSFDILVLNSTLHSVYTGPRTCPRDFCLYFMVSA